MMKIYCAPLDGGNGSKQAYSLLEKMFRAEYGGALPVINKTPNGKPFFPERPEIHFSLSHAGTHVLCALSDTPIGVDIESPREISPRAVSYFCSEEELRFFDPLDLWVFKESYIKLIGGVLTMVKSVRFSLVSEYAGVDCNVIKSAAVSVTAKKDGAAAVGEPAASWLYRVGDCRAAVSAFGDKPPCSIELISGSVDRLFGSE